MDLLQTAINAVVVGAVGLLLGAMVHGVRTEVSQLRAEVKADIAELRTEVKADIGQVRTEVRADISELRREVGELRSDLTQVALAVGARPGASRGP